MKAHETRTYSAKKANENKTAVPVPISNKNKELITSIATEDKIELERKEAYIEPNTRDLLRRLLQCCEKHEIIPTYAPDSGFIYHISSPDTLENHSEKISKSFLENLARLDILDKNFFDSISSCPNCQSSIITLHYRCPKCKSHNIIRSSLTEHIPCGCIDQRNNYKDDMCPKCGEQLTEGQYKNMGRWYVCNQCAERFENPEFDAVCRSCNKNFPIKEATVLEVPKFKLNLRRMKEIRQNVASLENIRTLLSDLGFSIEMPGFAMGHKSGMQHHFSLIGKKIVNGNETIIALDHSVSESEVQASPLILYIYKTSEVKVDIPIFIAMPKLNETAKKIAEGHNILVIEGSTDQQDLMEYIKQQIQNRIDLNAPVEQEPSPQQQQEKGSFLNKLRGKKN
jgi:ssDNA-binding Zn-finger/Zn-ribbon topoisomerase 1